MAVRFENFSMASSRDETIKTRVPDWRSMLSAHLSTASLGSVSGLRMRKTTVWPMVMSLICSRGVKMDLPCTTLTERLRLTETIRTLLERIQETAWCRLFR